ncbi:UDP-N-acetylglucosamine 1-carboxyvinyltransferase [Clostridium bowmanii]|uniref:UDP-N-acetylglucosamine 1-carboxyvinyltransferase n=1 Tax=Clostridium bowmanii TaxID=132925 RepID=UPI001C0E0DD3|nr:UDP-N-acetylglucosamine 1-carboxyvinyltransferase [Clostridium bowmanii]MBU3190348.1 UDP-N-acetylglucosamine 1-carboxyvinyltransferase [Clostridium bowmanii]MCA1072439.1 UDP-N-acetylglucosamine 1-carboxyvinyltransferase [Clostridium bowmanii]
MRWLEITRSNSLTGSITIPGSKNSSLPLLAACCLCDEEVTLKNIPNISDVSLVCDIAKDIGMKIVINNDKLILDPSNIHSSLIDHNKSAHFRASYYFAGALLGKFKRVSIGYPGGDDFGSRPIDQHIKGLEALGAKFNFYNDYYVVEAEKLIGADIYLDVISSGATINIMLAAVLAEGKTILRNVARDPEVVDVAMFLNEMGACVKGAGTDLIIIEGVKTLGGGTHCAIPDRLIAGSYLMAAAITGGNIKVQGIIPEHLISCTAKLKEAGVCIEEGNDFIRAYTDDKIQGINVKATMYPGFATDLQQPLTSMMLVASSHSVITDTVYPGRFNNCHELNRMGADIIIKEGSVTIPGNRSLKGAWVNASDVRAGISLILAGLIAEGTTYITGVEHIERGYVDIVKDFVSLGANIKLVEKIEEEEQEDDEEASLSVC